MRPLTFKLYLNGMIFKIFVHFYGNENFILPTLYNYQESYWKEAKFLETIHSMLCVDGVSNCSVGKDLSELSSGRPLDSQEVSASLPK